VSRSRRPAQLPKRPYRDSLLLNLGLGALILVFAWVTGGELLRAIGFAVAYVILATAWSWWRFRQRLQTGADR
jgi:Flp pilus assembly protein TadB